MSEPIASSFYFGDFDLYRAGCLVGADYFEYHGVQGRVEIDTPSEAIAFEAMMIGDGIKFTRSTPDPRTMV